MKSWSEYKTDGVKIENIKVEKSWSKLFKEIRKADKENWNFINEELTKDINNGATVYPIPDKIFTAFNMTPISEIKVVIILQDPYHGTQIVDGKEIQEATGLALSVPTNLKVPSSLRNIYNNLIEFDHIKPTEQERKKMHGCLDRWAGQGCLLMNTALTVQRKNPNSHKYIWNNFTNAIIKKLSENPDIIFVCWGNNALGKVPFMNKNKVIISSHPSGLSCSKPMKEYPAFCDFDHFGAINKFLKEKKKKQIDWNNQN